MYIITQAIKKSSLQSEDFIFMERMKGVEPSCQAWEACVLPMNYTRI